MVEVALSYASRGWRVFPVRLDKRPFTAHGCKDATSDHEQIRAWWAQWPDAGIGIATGVESGLAVLDIDHLSALALLQIPETLTAETGGGGRHFYFKHPGEKIGNSAKQVAPFVDVRGDGGYVVAPPSKHNSGNEYRWLNDAPLADWPSFPLDINVANAREKLKEHGPAVEGQGGDTHTYRAGAILINDFALSEDQAWPLMLEWNLKCQPRWEEEELRQKLANAGSYASGDPGASRVELLEEEPEAPRQYAATLATDLGNAGLFREIHHKRALHVSENKEWLQWDGARWAPMLSVIPLAVDVIAELEREAQRLELEAKRVKEEVSVITDSGLELLNEFNTILDAKALERLPDVKEKRDANTKEHEKAAERLKAATGHADAAYDRFIKAQARSKMEAMIAVAGGLDGMKTSAAELDTDAMLLGVPNGMVDLKTGVLLPANPEKRITKQAGVAYNPDAPCPQWEAFLSQVLKQDAELISFIHKAVGYSLTGDVREQVFFFLHGDGRNGKSTFLTTLSKILGSYATAGAPDLLLAKGSGHTPHPSDTNTLPGSRFVLCGEPGAGRRFDDAIIKQLTGNDPIATRQLYGKLYSFLPSHKIWVAANMLPDIKAQDLGIWRRVRLVPFTYQVPEAEQDRDLFAKLLGEAEGILAWAVRGCLAWQREGLGAPGAVQAAVEDYREEEDLVGQFLAERCETGPGFSMSSTEFYEAYNTWITRLGARALSVKTFWADLKRKGFAGSKSTGRRRVTQGIRTKPSHAGAGSMGFNTPSYRE